jgi:hypothetical protein
MNESSLHHELKLRYTGKGGKTEVTAGEYIADGRRKDGEYIEIQTGSFAPLKDKVKKLSANGRVRVIHPVAVTKTIEVYKPNKRKPYGALLYRKKSPLKGSQWNIFDALTHAPLLPLIRRLTVEVALVDILEKRIKDGKGSRRRKGISLYDKELTALHESLIFKKPADYLRFVPFKKNEEFTVLSHAEKAGIKRELSQKALYVLAKMNLIKRIGKNGNAWVYAR